MLDKWGGPRYPGLVAFSTRRRIDNDPELMTAFVDATARGYEDTLDDPEGCLDALTSEVHELDGFPSRRASRRLPAAVRRRRGPVRGLAARRDRGSDALPAPTGLTEARIPPGEYATNEFVGTTR